MKRYTFIFLLFLNSIIGNETEKPLLHLNLSLNSAEIETNLEELGLDTKELLNALGLNSDLINALIESPGELFVSISFYNKEVRAALLSESGQVFAKTDLFEKIERSKKSDEIFYVNSSSTLFPEDQLKIVRNRLIHSRISMKKLVYLEINISSEFKNLVFDRMKIHGMPVTNPYYTSFMYVDSISIGLSLNNIEISFLLSDTSRSKEVQTFADYLIVNFSLWLDNQRNLSSLLPSVSKFQLKEIHRDILKRVAHNSATTIFENELIVYVLFHEMEQAAFVSDLKLLLEQKKQRIDEIEDLNSAKKVCSQMQAGRFLIENVDRLTFFKGIRLEYSRSLLHCAVIGRNPRIVKKLIDLGFPIDSQDYDEETPLHLAARMGNRDVIQVLVNHGANRDLLNIDDLSAYNLAEEEGFNELLPMLSPSSQREDFLMLED